MLKSAVLTLFHPDIIGVFQIGLAEVVPYMWANPTRSASVTFPSLFKSAAANAGGNGLACAVLTMKDAEAIIETINDPKIAVKTNSPSFFILFSPPFLTVFESYAKLAIYRLRNNVLQKDKGYLIAGLIVENQKKVGVEVFERAILSSYGGQLWP